MAHSKAASNPNDFILPDLGEGVHEAELIKWRVSVGQAVNEHDILADMETDKALVEVPSPRSGVISVLHGKEGEILKVGNPLVSFAGEGGAAAPAAAPAAAASINGKHAPAAAAAPAASPAAAPAPAAPKAEEREDAGTVVGAVGGSLGGVSAAPGKALATPAVRRLARDLGVNIDAVAGTGMGGRVLEKDVRAAAAGGGRPAAAPAAAVHAPTAPAAPVARPAVAPPAPAARPAAAPAASAPAAAPAPAAAAVTFAPGAETERIPFRGVRRTIANRLRESVSQTVHFTVMDEADVTALEGLRKKLAAASGEKVSFLPFVASAVCRCLSGEFGQFNSTTDDKAEEIIRHRGVHLGIATDTEHGLMVPVIRDCDRLGVLEIGRHIAHVADSARNRTAPREMLSGSTFTISNVGSHAGRFATPIINYPEVGILAVGRARDGVVVRNGMMGVGKLLPLSLACDHRVVDGAAAALMLARIIELLQSPDQLLAPAR
ncbi:MAG: 2-oxo acid dehydrogenase subunit E2 [Planctomycetaceae bacterium]|jgi:pyruvate dehydrogenase E2 component (dihydrolipoamide acetyltransferase)|nr:2-oxo acid dehydrogenase subunit E2 [Phycisphaerales bacterium]MCE2654031.1 2-oxo acid dehydrogenase subunit E2 [Planctomycetaceae bacterium]